MAYVILSDIQTRMNINDITACCDDIGDGQFHGDVFNTIAQAASNKTDSFLASVYEVPFQIPPPAKVKEATIIFTCEMLYQRRLSPGAENSFKSQSDMWAENLQKIGNEKLPLDQSLVKAFVPGVAISHCSQLTFNRFLNQPYNLF
jgi:phage gp36-like protein